MPLALLGALILLLSGFSLQTLALHQRRQLLLEQKSAQTIDELASAAHQWAGRLYGPWRCLRDLPSSQWDSDPCSKGLDEDLALTGHTVALKSWQPSGASGGVLLLQLADGSHQRRFHLAMTGLRELI